MNSNLKNIVISFDRPKDSTDIGYKFLQNPPRIQGGGLSDQVVMVKEELSYADLVEDFIQSSELLSPIIGETASYVIGAIFSLAWNSTSIALFPDEYEEILDLIEETEDGNDLNLDKLNKLIKEDEEVMQILEALIKQKFLRRKKNGEYVVRKKVLTNTHISFLQIAD